MTEDFGILTPGDDTFRAPELEAALEAKDMIAIALALRTGVVVVPRMPTDDESLEVRVFPHRETGLAVLMLFSSAAAVAEAIPGATEVMLYDGPTLQTFLETYLDEIAVVIVDAGSPRAMQAAPADLVLALSAS